MGLKDDCTLEMRQKKQRQGNLYRNCQKIMQSLCERTPWHSLLSEQERSLQYCHGPWATNVPSVALYSKLFDKKGQQLWFTESLGAIILCFNDISDNSFSTRERTGRREERQKMENKIILISFPFYITSWNKM